MTWRTGLLLALLVSLVLWLLIYLLAVTTWRAIDGAPPDPRFVAASAGRAFVADMEGQPTTTTVAPTTTTHTHPPRARSAPTVRAASPAVYGSGACGGDLPPCSVMRCESGGNIRAENPRSSASGKWQIVDGTWAGFGGYARALHAPEEVQDAKARLLWAGGRGDFHWKSCL